MKRRNSAPIGSNEPSGARTSVKKGRTRLAAAVTSATPGIALVPLPSPGDLLELRWALDEGPEDDRLVWWPAIVLRGPVGPPVHAQSGEGAFDIIYTKDAEPQDAVELLRWKECPSDAPGADVTVERVFLKGNVASHELSGCTVAWRFATWRSSAPPPGTDGGESATRLVAVEKAQERISREVATLHAELRASVAHATESIRPMYTLRESAQCAASARKILRIFLRSAVEDSLRTGTPQGMRAVLEQERASVFGTVVTTRRADCTLADFQSVYDTVLQDVGPGARDRVSAYPSAHALRFPSLRQTGALHVRFTSYGDMCDALGIPLHSRALRAGRTKREEAVAVVGTTVLQPAPSQHGDDACGSERRLLVGHSCLGLFCGGGGDDAVQGVTGDWDIVALHQADTHFNAAERRSRCEFSAEKRGAADLAVMSRLPLPAPFAQDKCADDLAAASESQRVADDGAASEDSDQAASADSAAPDLTFDLSWTPLPAPQGTVFDAGTVPGSIVAHIPVVVVRTTQLILSVERQLLSNEGGGTADDNVRAGLRLVSVSSPAQRRSAVQSHRGISGAPA